jgi:arginase family enzyme
VRNGSLHTGTENPMELNAHPLWIDCGDVVMNEQSCFVEDIQSQCSELLGKGVALLSLGADHSVTYPIFRAYSKHFAPLNILHMDAHSDLYHSFKGNKLSNACLFARIMEEGLCKGLVQIGIRTLNAHQREQARRFDVEMIQMQDSQHQALPDFDGPLYLSLETDGIAPAFALGVPHREPVGLSSPR